MENSQTLAEGKQASMFNPLHANTDCVYNL